MAVEAGFADRRRPEALERSGIDGEISLEEHFPVVELFDETLLLNCRRLVFVTAFSNVQSGSKKASWIPFLGSEITHGFTDIFSIGPFGFGLGIAFGIDAAGHREQWQCRHNEPNEFHDV